MNKPQGPTARGSKKISLAMIVKDEEENLPACLESVAPWVDEIVVVDTGSTDRTPQIAASFGARVFRHPWQQNFSLHRNQSIGYCTGDWVLIMDADEELEAGSGEVLRQAANEASADVVCAVVRSTYDFGRGAGANVSNRLFRNRGGIRYEGRVHNLLVGYQSTETWPIRIHHKGYNLDEAGMAAKFERTATLLKQDIAEDPLKPRPHHYLAVSYLSRRMYPEAAHEAREAIRLAAERGDNDALYIWSHHIAALACLDSGRLDEAEAFCQAALTRWPLHFDSHFVLARVALERSEWERVFVETEKYLELAARFHQDPAPFGQVVYNTAGYGWHAWHYQAIAYTEMGRAGEAEEAFGRALAAAPDSAHCLRLRGRYHGYVKKYEEARRYLDRALELRPNDPEVLLDLAATWCGQGSFDEERRVLERLLAVRFEPGAAARLGRLELGAGELAAARAHLEEALGAEPENASALINLGVCLRMMGEPVAALDPLERARRLDPDSVEVQTNLALALLAAGDPRAREALESAVGLRPGAESSDLRLKLCRLALEEGDVDGLIGHLQALLGSLELTYAVRLEGMQDLADLLVRVGERLLDSGRGEAAGEAFDLACEVAPGLRRDIAALYRSRRLWREALGQLEASLAADPARETLLEMGDLYVRLGLPEAASFCRSEAARLPSAGPEGRAVV